MNSDDMTSDHMDSDDSETDDIETDDIETIEADDADTDDASSGADEVDRDGTAEHADRAADSTPGAHAGARPASIPVPPPPPTTRRFVRDPYARFGGVASGLAHYFGWDVSLTRLGVIVLFIVSGGTAILAYLLAWLIVPRATHWPPSGGAAPATRLSSRDIGIGLVVLGGLLALAIAGGRPGAVLVPLALIGGGIWLLSQDSSRSTPTSLPGTGGAPPPRPAGDLDGAPASFSDPNEAVPSPVEPTMPLADSGGSMTATAVASPPAVPPPAPPPVYDPGPPVPPRPRARKWIVRTIVGLVLLLLLAILAIPIGLFFLARSGNLDIDPDERVVVRPAAVSEIPDLIVEDAAEVVLDLRDLDPVDFVGEDTPVRVEVDLDAGEIRVRLPDDLRASVDASVGVGNVEVFGSDSGGFFPDRRIDADDAHVDLELDVGFGQILVERD